MNNQSYIGKWCVVLGGSSGLGLATAQKLAKEGMHICIVHRSRRSVLPAFEAQIKQMQSAGSKVIQYNIDAMNPKKRIEVVEDLKTQIGLQAIHMLVHSIARGNLKPMSGDDRVLSNEDFKGTIDAMAVSLYDWVSAFAKADLFAQNARVVAFTSEGSSRAWPQYGAVAAAKAALESITRGIALEFAASGLRANCIQAGVTDTESLRLIPGSDTIKEMAKSRNPYGRLTIPENIADAVYLLSRDEALWINGTVIPVDGGEHIR